MARLINVRQVKRYILEVAGATRPQLGMRRVSAEAIDQIEEGVRRQIAGLVRYHPSKGKTFHP